MLLLGMMLGTLFWGCGVKIPHAVSPACCFCARMNVSVWGVAFSRDHRWLAVGGGDARYGPGVVAIWDRNSSRCLHRWERDSAYGDLHFSSDSRFLLALGSDESLLQFPCFGGQPEQITVSRDAALHGPIAMLSDNDSILFAYRRSRIVCYQHSTMVEQTVTQDHTEWIISFAVSPDGSRLATITEGGKLRIWDPKSQTCLGVKETPGDHLLIMSRDTAYLATGGNDGIARVWRFQEQPEIARCPAGGRLSSLAFSSDGNWLAIGTHDGSLTVWDWLQGRKVAELYGHRRWITQVVFSQDGRWLASCSTDKTARVWDLDVVLGICK